MKQWLRKASLVVGKGYNGIEVADLRIKFDVKKTNSQTPNQAKFTVYNLSDATCEKILREFDNITLEAGYEAGIGLIYSGNITGYRKYLEGGTNKVLEIYGGDGDKAYNWAVCNKTLAAGATQGDIFKETASTMQTHGVKTGSVASMGDVKLPRGKVMFGPTKGYMKRIAQTTDTSWSIQDGKINYVENNGVLKGESVLLNWETGLIKAPEQTNDGINISCLLNPLIRVGGTVKIDNSAIIKAAPVTEKSKKGDEADDKTTEKKAPAAFASDGVYRVIEVQYIGDTWGADWFCNIIGVSIDVTTGKTKDKGGV